MANNETDPSAVFGDGGAKRPPARRPGEVAGGSAPAQQQLPTPAQRQPSAASIRQLPAAAADDDRPKPWGAVVQDVFSLDVDSTYQRLRDELRLGEGATQYGIVLKALDAAAKNVFDAGRLARAAKIVEEQYAITVDIEIEVLRSSVVEELTREHKEGKFAKAPSLKDIDDRMLANWPEKLGALKKKKAEMHGALRAIEGLEGAWRGRSEDLRKIADRVRAGG